MKRIRIYGGKHLPMILLKIGLYGKIISNQSRVYLIIVENKQHLSRYNNLYLRKEFHLMNILHLADKFK